MMLKQSKIYLTEPRGYTDKLNLHRQGNNHKHKKKTQNKTYKQDKQYRKNNGKLTKACYISQCVSRSPKTPE